MVVQWVAVSAGVVVAEAMVHDEKDLGDIEEVVNTSRC